MRKLLFAALLAATPLTAQPAAWPLSQTEQADPAVPPVIPLRDRARIEDKWLAERLDLRVGDAGLVAEGSVKERNLMRQMRGVWDNAPTNPKMDGARVRLPGYVVPLEEIKNELKEFLLMPYFGACIHSPPPPANQIVHVLAAQPLKGWRTMDAVWVNGTLKATRSDSAMGTSGYSIADPVVERYVPKPRP